MQKFWINILIGLCSCYSAVLVDGNVSSKIHDARQCRTENWIDDISWQTRDELTRRQRVALRKIEGNRLVDCSLLEEVHRMIYGKRKPFPEDQYRLRESGDNEEQRTDDDDDVDGAEETIIEPPLPPVKAPPVAIETPKETKVSSLVADKENQASNASTLSANGTTPEKVKITKRKRSRLLFYVRDICSIEETITSGRFRYYFLEFNVTRKNVTNSTEKERLLSAKEVSMTTQPVKEDNLQVDADKNTSTKHNASTKKEKSRKEIKKEIDDMKITNKRENVSPKDSKSISADEENKKSIHSKNVPGNEHQRGFKTSESNKEIKPTNENKGKEQKKQIINTKDHRRNIDEKTSDDKGKESDETYNKQSTIPQQFHAGLQQPDLTTSTVTSNDDSSSVNIPKVSSFEGPWSLDAAMQRFFSSVSDHSEFTGKLNTLETNLHDLEKKLLNAKLSRSEDTAQHSKLESSIYRLESEIAKLTSTVSKLTVENEQLKTIAQQQKQNRKSDYLALPEALKGTEMLLQQRVTTQTEMLNRELHEQEQKVSRLTKTVNDLRSENLVFAEQMSLQRRSMEDLSQKLELLLRTQQSSSSDGGINQKKISGTETSTTAASSLNLELPFTNDALQSPPKKYKVCGKQRFRRIIICRLLQSTGLPICCFKSEEDFPALPTATFKMASSSESQSTSSRSTKGKEKEIKIKPNLADAKPKTHKKASSTNSDEKKESITLNKEEVKESLEPRKPLSQGGKPVLEAEKKNADKINSETKNSENLTKDERDRRGATQDQVKDAKTEKEPCLYCNPKHSKPKECYDYWLAGKKMDTVMKLTTVANATGTLRAFCEMKTGGWTVIMRRTGAKVDFYREWDDYAKGFGDPFYDHWLGNDAIHHLTNQNPIGSELLIELTDWSGETRTALYTTFRLDAATSLDSAVKGGYQLTVGGYSGTAGDGLSAHSGNLFSTYDVDQDRVVTKFGGSCARRFKGAWWYYSCYKSNLTGKYYQGGTIPAKQFDGIIWKPWKGTGYSLKKVVMKIKPKVPDNN